MRRLLLGLTLAVALLTAGTAAAVPGRHSLPTANPHGRQTAADPLAAPPTDAPSLDDCATVNYNHFGNPSAGQAVIQGCIRQTYSDLALPITAQGQGRAVRLLNVDRIAIRIVLHTRGGTDDADATGPTYNNGSIAGNPRNFLALSPTISTGGLVPNPQWCVAWWTVYYAIRWADGTLTSGKTLEPAASLFNDNCYFRSS